MITSTTSLVIHSIRKESGVNEAHTTISSACVPVNENRELLCQRLNSAFRKDDRIIKTEFSQMDEPRFRPQFEILKANLTSETFLDFSQRVTHHLAQRMRSLPLATGGYLVYAQYEVGERNYMGIFLVRDVEEIAFNHKENAYEIRKAIVINTNRLAMSARLNITADISVDLRYLEITHSQRHESEYFMDWVEANLQPKSTDDTKALVKVINAVPADQLPTNPDTNVPYTSTEFRNKVHDYAQSVGKRVNIKQLGIAFFGNEEYFIQLAETNNIQISTEFRADNRVLNQLRKYEVKSGSLKLAFTQADIDTGVVKAQGKNGIVITSEELRAAFDARNK